MKICICDDDRNIVEFIEESIVRHNPTCQLMIYYSGEEVLEHDSQIDMIFLDIAMRRINGIDTYSELKKKNPMIIAIFISSHIEFISETFRMKAFQFLIKPLKKADIIKEYERGIETYRNLHYQHVISYNGAKHIFNINEIMYIEIVGRHLCLHTENNSCKYNGNLKAEFLLLEKYNFVKIHQGCIINLIYINNFTKKEFSLKNGTTLLLGRKYRDSAIDSLTNYLAERTINL